MAGIDHTCIHFKNNKLLRDHCHCDFVEYTERWTGTDGKDHESLSCKPINEVELLPYDTTRDGLFIRTNGNLPYQFSVSDEDTDAYDVDQFLVMPYFKSKGEERKAYALYKKHPWEAREKWPEQFNQVVYHYKDENYVMFSIDDRDGSYCATFFFDLKTKDSYVTMGGYGHYSNPYMHFYHRGYGEEFERKMALECYRWLCDRVFKMCFEACMKDIIVAEQCFDTEYSLYYKMFLEMLRYKDYFDMNEEERIEYEKTEMMDYDLASIFPDSQTFPAQLSEEFKELVDSI